MTFNDSRWEQERKARMGRVAKATVRLPELRMMEWPSEDEMIAFYRKLEWPSGPLPDDEEKQP